ncbi:MAG: GGDEF domain-containing protein [Aquabacterium sp.]
MQPHSGASKFDPHELTAERVRHLYRHRNAAWWTHSVSGAFVAMLLWPTFRFWALVWYLCFVAAQGWHWMMGRVREDGERLLVPMASVKPHRFAAALAGGAWGLAGLSLPWLGAQQVPTVLVLVVMATVIALPRMAAMPDIFLSFAAAALLPLAASAVWLPFEQAQMVWLVVGLVSAVLWVSSRAVEADLMDVVTKRLSLERMAWEDKLTGLANRRRFDAVLAEEWRRAARMKVPLSLVLLDVDHFKRFNDTYGHTSGDACLTLVGGVLASTVRRAGDFAARYGGEEFVVLLFHTSRADAVHLAERVRQAVRALSVDHSGSPHGQVTVSMGGATMVPEADASPQVLLDQADEALYQAKEQGRDRVLWSKALL